MYSKYKHFFWLFFCIGFFLSIFLVFNEYFSNQIFVQRYDAEVRKCVNEKKLCDIEVLKLRTMDLDANQKKILELGDLIDHHVFFYWNILRIFGLFILVGISPFICVWIKQQVTKSRY